MAFDNGSPELGVLSDAIDSEEPAIEWLKKNNLILYVVFADACRGVSAAKQFLKKENLDIFVRLAETINDVLKQQQFDDWDYHKYRRR